MWKIYLQKELLKEERARTALEVNEDEPEEEIKEELEGETADELEESEDEPEEEIKEDIEGETLQKCDYLSDFEEVSL